MTRRVRRKVVRTDKEKVDPPQVGTNLTLDESGVLDWTKLPEDIVIQLFSCLNYRDRASLSSTCRAWRALSMSPCLWKVLDLRPYKCDAASASLLASRCENLQKLRFRGPESVNWIIHLNAKNVLEISGDGCKKMTDALLTVLAARHESLECLQIGPESCDWIGSETIRVVALCCKRLKKLWLSGIHEVDADAINALAEHCPNLMDLGFIDCQKVDETALGNIASLRYLSVAGTNNIKWNSVVQEWNKLTHLIGLDVSRTNVSPDTISSLFSCTFSLKVICALSCPALEGDAAFVANKHHKGKVLLSVFTDILKGVAQLCVTSPKDDLNLFLQRRDFKKDMKVDEILNWLECVISSSLLRISERNSLGLDYFWIKQGTTLLLSFMQSTQEEVQERAATALATFVVIDDENAGIDSGRAEAVIRKGGMHILLNLARSLQEVLQSEAAKAIANLSVNPKAAAAVAEEGGISILANLARSVDKLVAEEAAGGLWNLSVGEEHKGSIAEAGGVKALVDLIFKWSKSAGGEGVLVGSSSFTNYIFLIFMVLWYPTMELKPSYETMINYIMTGCWVKFEERAAGALANLAADDKCGVEVTSVGGVHALVMLAQSCKVEGVQEQAARGLANLAAHGDTNGNNAAVGQEVGAIDALMQLIRSTHDGVRQEAAGALWNLSFDDKNREAIATAGGVEALVALAQSCSNASHGLQERAAGALWGLSVSEANSIAIGQVGGVTPLIQFARSDAEDVHETAAGALWNLAFNPGNALRIIEEGGVNALVHLCSSSKSKMARFMSALALTYMFDGRCDTCSVDSNTCLPPCRMDEIVSIGTSANTTSRVGNLTNARKLALKHIEAFVMSFSDPQVFSTAIASSAPAALAHVTESVRIPEAGHLRCCGSEIGRFVAMLRNPSPTLKSCAAFALLQFSIPGGRHAVHHVRLLQSSGAPRVLRAAAAAAGAPLEAKAFARIVLRNLEHHQMEQVG